MTQIGRLLFAALLALLPISAAAQQFNTIPSGTVIGRTAIGPGPAQPVPIQQLFNALLTGALSVPSVNTRSVIYRGSTSGQATVSAQAVAGTPALALPNTSGTLASNATSPIVLNATTGNISCPSCLSVANATPVLASRAYALTQNLSTLAAVRTLGYAAGGDGGGAVFKNIGTAPFIDSFVTGYTITGGSGYTNGGPYYGVLFSNGTKPYVVGTVTVSGGVITAVNITGTPGNQCAVGDVYTIAGSAAATASPASGLPATGTGASLTVTACSTPLGSFTDSVGTRFQFVPDGLGPVITQFGANGDWNGTDASATDNYSAIQACLWTAGFKSSTSYDAGGFWGGRCIVPQGSFMACGTGLKPLIVANGVMLHGTASTGSTIKFCSAWGATTIQVELGDPNWHFACFNSSLWFMELRSDSGTGYMVHSNCTQDFGGVYQSHIFSNGAGARGCLQYEKSYGGGSKFTIWNLSCAANSAAPQIWLGNTDASGLNLGTTIVEVTGLVLGANSSGLPVQSAPGLTINGGWVTATGVHCESMPQCVKIDVSVAAGGFVKLTNVNAGNGNPSVTCTGTIQFSGTNATTGNNIMEQVQGAGSCTHTVDNGMSGGASYNPGIGQQATFNPNYSSF